MARIEIVVSNIENMNVDAVVNAANSELRQGGGVCGAIFKAAGSKELQAACKEIGRCATGKAVITPGFNLQANYIIHAVGPDFRVFGLFEKDKDRKLYECYQESLKLAEKNNCVSIAFPLISSGIYGCPKKKAWEIALKACYDYTVNHKMPETVYFATLNDEAQKFGLSIYDELYS